MEANGVGGRINVSQTAFDKLRNDHFFEEHGVVQLKEVGQILTYLFKERKFVRTESGHFIRKAAITPPTLRKKGSGTRTPIQMDSGVPRSARGPTHTESGVPRSARSGTKTPLQMDSGVPRSARGPTQTESGVVRSGGKSPRQTDSVHQ